MPPRGKAEDQKAAFAKRLLNLRVAKGWNQSELARQAAIHMPTKNFNRDNISKYEKGTVLPLPIQLNALARALSVTAQELLPEAHNLTTGMDDTAGDSFTIQSSDDGKAWVRINQKVDMGVALEIMKLLKKDENGAHT